MTILKFALLGAGRIGKIHAANIALNPKCSIECIYDIDSNNAKKISNEFLNDYPESVYSDQLGKKILEIDKEITIFART